MSGKFDYSTNGPGVFGVSRLASELNTTPDELLGHSLTDEKRIAQSKPPTIEKLLSRLALGGRHLRNFSEFAPYFQIFDKPSNSTINLVTSGPLALAPRIKKTIEAGPLVRLFEEFTPEVKAVIYGGQMKAWNEGLLLDTNYMSHYLAEEDKLLKLHYFRLIIRVETDENDKLLVYCDLIDP